MNEPDCDSAPNWLTSAYLETVLRKYKNDKNLQITNLQISPCTPKGENYASVMLRVMVKYITSISKTETKASFIVKTCYKNDSFEAKILSGYDIYNTEMLMYEKILPELTDLLKELGDESKIVAETIHVDYERIAIIFEDLSVNNYITADRLAGMDMQLTKLTLMKLAKFHATAAVYNERNPGVLTKFDHGIFNRHTRGFSPFFENVLGVCANFAGDCPELGAHYKDKLIALQQRVVEYATRVHDNRKEFFLTLNHGDFWINNVMLRYKQNNGTSTTAEDMMLIDFQFCNWASPAVDLHYFFNTSLKNELRFNQQDELVQYYYEILVGTLKQLKFKGFIPTLHEFVVQLEVGRFYAVTSALIVQPIMINDKTEDADFGALMFDDERGRNFRNILYKNKVVQCNVKKILPYFDRKGLLDVVD